MRTRPVVVALVLALSPIRLAAQALDVRVVGDMLHVRGAALGLIEGSALDHLKDGRSVNADIELTVLDRPAGMTIAQARQRFILSFDLWEQRFAVTRAGTPPRSISHLKARDAEAWCLDNVTVAVSALGRFARETPFWVRLQSRVQNREPAPPGDDEPTFTLRRLIDAFSRRRQDQDMGRSLEAGPFRLGK